jgi:hypothetical protein
MRTLLLLLIGCVLAAASPPKPAATDCPPKRAISHCVYLSLKKGADSDKTVKLFKADGVDASSPERLEITAMMTDAQLRKLLRAKVSYNMTGASSKDAMICEASIDSVNPLERYQAVESARIDSACP